MAERDFAELATRVRQARAVLEGAHEGVLALLDHGWLLRYEDLRELIRRVDRQISDLQPSLLSLLDVLANLTGNTEPGPPGPDAES